MKAIFLSTFRFPDNDAGSLRYSFLSKLFAESGFTPYFIGKGETSINKYSKNKYGFFISLRNKNKNKISKAWDTLVGFEKKLVRETKRLASKNDIIVITCFFSKATNEKIIKFADHKGIKVIFSIEEKYSKSEFRKGDLISLIGYRKCVSFYKNIAFYKKPIIAISSYIGEFARTANVPFVVIPFVYDDNLSVPDHEPVPLDKIRFFYAGTPGKKDLLMEMIKGFNSLDVTSKKRIEVNVFGFDDECASRWLPKNLYTETKDFVNFRGRVERERISLEIVNSDFSILLRDSREEFAQAGFPTKVAESLFYGIPVIANLTSDLSLYLEDGLNSIVVKGDDGDSFRDAIEAAIKISPANLLEMKKEARNTSLKKLTTKCFRKDFEEFLLCI